MFANDYQGGTHVEVLGTQGQNPLSQWKVTGPQKGPQKVYDKALKGYVFVSGSGCRLALPKDERAALGLVQPHLLLQLEVGVGVPFSVEVGVTDASSTRRRIILSSSFSELKCTPLHCQVPFSSLPRECWLNLVLPLADLAAALFRAGGPAAVAAAAAGGGAAVSSSPYYRSLDSLQIAGPCRLRRICTLRDIPQPSEGSDGSNSPGPAGAKPPWEFPPGVDCQALILDPRSLALISLSSLSPGGVNGTLGVNGSSTSSAAAGGGGGGSGATGGLGIVGTSTGSARRSGAAAAAAAAVAAAAAGNGGGGGAGGNAGSSAAPLLSVNIRGGAGGMGGKGVVGTAAVGPAAPSSGDEEAGSWAGRDDSQSGPMLGLTCTALCHLSGEAGPKRGSSSGQSTPTARGGGGGGGWSNSGVPTLPPACGAAAAASAGGGGSSNGGGSHSQLNGLEYPPSRLGRSPSGGSFSPTGAAVASHGQHHHHHHLPRQHHQHQQQQQQQQHSHGQQTTGGTNAATSSVPVLPSIDGGGGGGGGHGGLKLPPVHLNGLSAAAVTAAAVGGTSGDDISNRGDSSPYGGRRAFSAQTVARYSGSGGTSPSSGGGGGAGPGVPGGAVGGGGGGGGAAAGAVAGGAGSGSGLPPSPPWPKSVMGKRAQSGPARISTEALSQGLGDTVAPSDTPMSPSLAPRPGRRTPNATHIPPTIIENEIMPSSRGGGTGGASTPVTKSPSRSPSRCRPSAISTAAAAAQGCSALPQLRVAREPVSPTAHGTGGSAGNAFSQLSSVLRVRGGVDASVDLASQQHLLDGSPGSSCILSSNPKLLNGVAAVHAHRYGGGGGAAAAAAAVPAVQKVSGISTELSSESVADSPPPPASSSVVAAAAAQAGSVPPPQHQQSQPPAAAVMTTAMDVATVKVPRIRTRVAPSSAVGGGRGGAGGGVSNDGTVRAPGTPASGTGSPVTPGTRRVTGSSPDGDTPTPTRAGRAAAAAAAAAASHSGRNSPANTPVKAAGAGRAAPFSSNGGPGPSNLGPGMPSAGRQRRDDGPGGAGGGGGAARGSAVPSTSERQTPVGNAPAARQRGPGTATPTPPAVTTRATPQRAGAPASRLPPLGAGRGRGAAGGPAAAGAAAGAGGAAGGGRRVAAAGGRPSMRSTRPTTSNEVDVEESITLNAGMWGGFGVDEDDEVLGSRHFRHSDSDGEGGGCGAVHKSSGSSSPDTCGYAAGGTALAAGADDLPSPPVRYGNAGDVAAAAPSPPIRRASETYGTAWTSEREATFSGYADGRGDGADAAADGGLYGIGAGGSETLLPHDPMLDEEALLAGHMHQLDMYDDWGKVDQRPTPAALLHPHRAFTPPVVPASKALGIALSGGQGAVSGTSAAGPQVLRVSGGGGGGGGRAHGGGVVAPAGDEAMLDLVYDPVLNCYYDSSSGQYYTLKT